MAFNLKGLSVGDMLAQRVMPRLDGERLGEDEYFGEALRLVEAGVGGFILFGGGFHEVRERLARLQAKAKVPLLIASDMERGAGQQLTGATVFPCQMAVAAATDAVSRDGMGLVSEMLEGIAAEARWAGVHAVLGPVLDVNSNPDNPIICTRAFSDEPRTVTAFGEQYVSGLQDAPIPVMACAKHYPGHGEAALDSHTALPTLDKDKASVEEEDMLPFRRAVMKGVEMVMTAHLKVTEIDPDYPASLSHRITRGYLRNRAGFQGLIVTDALDMGALADRYAPMEAARLAIKSGADILLHPPDPAGYIAELKGLYARKEVTKEDVMSSAGRIQRAKERYCRPVKAADAAIRERMSEDAATADAIAQRALTLVKAGGAFPALADVRGQVAHVVLEDDGDMMAGRVLRSVLTARHKRLTNLFVTKSDLGRLKDEAMKRAKKASLVIISIFSKVRAGKGNSGLSPELLELGRQMIKANPRTVAVSFGSPYLLRQFMDAEHVVAAYDPSDAMQQAACRAFMGEIVFMGNLPVRI